MTDAISLNLNPAKATAGSGNADFGDATTSDPAASGNFGKILSASLTPDAPGAPLPAAANFAGNLPETGKLLPDASIPAKLDGPDAATSSQTAKVAGNSRMAKGLTDGRIPMPRKLAAGNDATPDSADTAAEDAPSADREEQVQPQFQIAAQTVVALPMPQPRPAEPGMTASRQATAADQSRVALAVLANNGSTPARNVAATPSQPPVVPTPPANGITIPLDLRARVLPAKSEALAKSTKPAGTENIPNPQSTPDSNLIAIAGMSASPSGQGDDGQGQPPMARQSAHSPAEPSAIVSPEASSGPANPVIIPSPPVTSLPAPVAITAPSQAPAAHDMASLVDRLVEARAAARGTGSETSVTTSVRHAEFGQVSLQFRTTGNDLTVSMSSNDPGFAPAAQAALATAPAVDSATSASSSHGRQSEGNAQHGATQSGWTLAQQNSGRQQQRPQAQAAQGGFAAASRTPKSPSETTIAGVPAQSGVFA